jgi:hypothetical protein
VNIYDILFQTVSNLIDGLVVDLQTAMVGVLLVSLVVMGLFLLRSVLLDSETAEDKEEDKSDLEEFAKSKRGSHVS